MAKVEVIRGEPVEPPITEVVLRMSEREAKSLRAIIGSIGGWHKDLGRTRDDVWKALRDAGISGHAGDPFRYAATLNEHYQL